MTDATPRIPRRANGEGSIYPYRGRFRAAVAWMDATGILRHRTVSAKTRPEASRALRKLQEQLDKGLEPAAPKAVGAFLSDWLAASKQRIRPASWRRAELAVRLHLVPYIGRLPLAKLSPSDVERVTATLIESGRAPRTAHTARAVLHRALADAQRDGLVHRNVAALARPPHVPVRALTAGRDYFEPADLRRLITAAKVHRLGPLVTLAATTGLRLGEVLGLAWSDLDFEAATLTVRRSLARSWDGWALAEPKTARSRRTIHLPPTAIGALERQRELQAAAKEAVGSAWQDRDGLVFTSDVGRPLRGDDVNDEWHRLLDAAGLPSIPFHGLRHSAATAMLVGGVPLKVVSDQLGHSTITITADRYAGVVPAQKREAADAMERALIGDRP